MDADSYNESFSPRDVVDASEPESEVDDIDSTKGLYPNGYRMRELESARETLTKIELETACFYEKLVNLNILLMHVETRESEFDIFASDIAHDISSSYAKALEFDLLTGIFDSEVKELEFFMPTLQADISNARALLSLSKHLGEAIIEMEDKLHDSEKSLEQSLEQIREIKVQSTNFETILLRFDGEENWDEKKDGEFGENGHLSDQTAIKMQTAEQQRHILRMLEKSLATELDLDKKVTDSRQIEEDLSLRLHSVEQEVLYVEKDAEGALERFLEADNMSAVLMVVSKELLGQLHLLQFNLNGSVKRESELSSKLEDVRDELIAKDIALQLLQSGNGEFNRIQAVEAKLAVAESETSSLKDKVRLLENKLKESEILLLSEKASTNELSGTRKKIEDVRELSEAECRAENVQANRKPLQEAQNQLNEESNILRNGANMADKVNSLEKQLRESEIQLQTAVASAEASMEKQNMLYSTIKDMENVIEDLKSKVLKAASQTESAEEKCILLSESNSELSAELSFARGRVENLEASLLKSEEMKKVTAKDIGLRGKLITDLITQLAFERQRLQKQIYLLKQENEILVMRSKKMDEGPAVRASNDLKVNSTVSESSKPDLSLSNHTVSSKKDVTQFSSATSEIERTRDETERGLLGSTMKLRTHRNIDPRQLNPKLLTLAAFMLAIPLLGALLFQTSGL